ncbi:hypothetical protein L596_004142 [Steinernema carpocapsae]|uniref:Uncharacterized protein n=1 Tax=Steinernema carpocapsae TaxID=34508 RepID=A0A4U8UYY8_STECR|nr:hypothetical protein L596_004142 [Steinernema carpocapsae]
MYLPIPVFWALYDQQGSVWVFQSLQMDCQVGSYLLLPDQMQTVNAVLILAFIPLFQIVVYPIFSKCFNLTPLRKMVVGGFIAAIAFVISGLVQLAINKTLPNIPQAGHTNVAFVNALENCNVTVHYPPQNRTYELGPGDSMRDDIWNNIDQTFKLKSGNQTFTFSYDGDCYDLDTELNVTLNSGKIQYVTITPSGFFNQNVDTDKPGEGNGEFKLSMNFATDVVYKGNLALCRQNPNGGKTKCDSSNPSDFVYWEDYDGNTHDIGNQISIMKHGKKSGNVTPYGYKSVRPGDWELFYLHNHPKQIGESSRYHFDECQVNDEEARRCLHHDSHRKYHKALHARGYVQPRS